MTYSKEISMEVFNTITIVNCFNVGIGLTLGYVVTKYGVDVIKTAVRAVVRAFK